MGALTLTQYSNRLRSRLGENDSFSSPTDYYAVWINSGYRYLATLEKIAETKRHVAIPDLETSASAATVDGQAYVTDPTDALIVREVFDETNDKRLDWISWQEYIGKTDRGDTSKEGKPTYWNWRSGNIYLYPTPGAVNTLTVYYKKRVADMTAGDYSGLGAEWDDVIIELGHYYARMHTNEYDRADVSEKAAKKKIIELVDAYGSQERARRERVQPDPQISLRTY
jgi:hypothetical protein